MNADDETHSWFARLKHFLQKEPQNQAELINLVRDAHGRALIDFETLRMIEGVILFAQLRVRDIMLPKQQMVSISERDNFATIIEIITRSGHSRFPVTDANDDDEIIGILHAKDLLRYQANPESLHLNDLIRQTPFVPESKRLDILLSEFKTNRNHMALVVDEYGSVSGFVTIEDIIEQIIGDIEDEFDIDDETYIKAYGNARYIVKAHTPIEEFNEQLHTTFNTTNYDTIGGIVMAAFGYLPQRGESVTIDQLEFKVLNADIRRINLLSCNDLRKKLDLSIPSEEL